MRQGKAINTAPDGGRERLRQLAWAALIALVLHVSSLLAPLDQLSRAFVYTFTNFPASGDIVFIGAGDDLTDARTPQRREELAQLIGELDRAGVDEIFVDLVFERSSTTRSDAVLRKALLDTNGRAVMVEPLQTGLNGTEELRASTPAVARGADRVGSYIWTDFFYGIAWDMNYWVESGDERLPNVATRMAGYIETGEEADTFYPISYFFDLSTIPTYRFKQLLGDPSALAGLAGKKVIIGTIEPPGTSRRNMPGLPGVSPSIINIYAAETLKAGFTKQLDGWSMLAVVFLAMFASVGLPHRRFRYAAYGVACLLLPVAMIATAQVAMVISPAAAIFMLIVYSGFRARAVWKRGFRLVDADTNLPTFAALEADNDVSETVPTIIVAKIHRFEEVRRTLPSELHAQYVLRIIARLKAATQDATIYIGQGHLIAWTMAEKEPALLIEHLEGLRALFSSPLLVGDNQVDVGITFGVDITTSPNVTRRLAAAVSASEATNETFEPINIADSASDEDLIWNISLQARIDAALANGEIFLVYQPKIDVASGTLVGVEALVRWNDPVKGLIPPDQFIRQCENAGRMSHLTRHVLRVGCEAGQAFVARGTPVPIAINISATMLHERSIVRMVHDVLSESGFDPRLLMLEITETYRISNLDLAASILAELKSLGTKISMDDFGVGAASLEALMQLPFSELKIDRLFISKISTDAKALAIVRHVLKLGSDMGITVVAEGVEDDQILNILHDSGCKVAQGFGISRPASFEEIVKFQQRTASLAEKNGLRFTNKAG